MNAALPAASSRLPDSGQLIFLKQSHSDEQGHRHFHIVGDLEADDFQDGKLTLGQLQNDHFAWLGAACESGAG